MCLPVGQRRCALRRSCNAADASLSLECLNHNQDNGTLTRKVDIVFYLRTVPVMLWHSRLRHRELGEQVLDVCDYVMDVVRP